MKKLVMTFIALFGMALFSNNLIAQDDGSKDDDFKDAIPANDVFFADAEYNCNSGTGNCISPVVIDGLN